MNKGTVLVIDDDPMNLKLIKTVIELKGNYIVLEAMNAREGIKKAYEYHPDVIIMDMHMPEMDGLTTTRLIKLDSELKDIPVVAVSANAMQIQQDRAIEAGCSGYITKPIDTRNFLNTMEQFM